MTILRENKKMRVCAIVAALCAVAVALAIFALTQQAPEETMAESDYVNGLLVESLGDVPDLYDATSELWLGIHVRHWAHAFEFGVLGLFVCLAVVLAFEFERFRVKGVVLAGVASLAACALCSIADQCHKLFVPGRHFDWFDLAMDALGYCIATALVLVVAAVLLKARHVAESGSE